MVEHATENRGVASSILALGIGSVVTNRLCGCSSVVERLLAKEKVEGSNPFARSSCSEWLIADDTGPESRLRSAELHMATWPSWKGKGLQNPDHGFESRRRLFLGGSELCGYY